jgi:hypothetical protein
MTQATRELSAPERQHERLGQGTAAVGDAPVSAELADLIRRRPASDQMSTAVVEDISPDGVAKIVVAGDTQSCDALSLLQFPSAAAASETLLGRSVLVALNRHTQPVILGVVQRRLWDSPGANDAREAHVKLATDRPVSVQADKRTLDLEAADEIRLTCGKSSLVLRRDGTVVVRGVNIVSRASQSNKIKGGTVGIN